MHLATINGQRVKRNHEAADPKRCLENALRVLALIPDDTTGLCPDPKVTIAAEIKQAMEAL